MNEVGLAEHSGELQIYSILIRNEGYILKEILTMGDITKDFQRLGIIIRQTYNGEDYGVCEVNDEEFKILCNEDDTEGIWEDCGWRYCEGSNQEVPNKLLSIKGQKINGWYGDDIYEDEDEENSFIPTYRNLLLYLCASIGCSQPRNVCALAKDLAFYNNMKLSDLFIKYQG